MEPDHPVRGYVNIGGMIGTLIAQRVATLYELQTVYSLNDAMDMYEAIAIPQYNEWKAYQVQKWTTI